MTGILTLVNSLSCTELVICFGVVSIFLTIFINNIWISLCYFGALPAGVLLGNQLCSRTKFLDTSAFLLTIRHIHQYCQTFSNVGKLNTELSNISTSHCKTATLAEPDHTPAAELSICLDYIIRDFFESWYCNISTEPQCLTDAHQYLTSVFNNLFDKLRKIDTDEMICELSVICIHHLQDIHKAEIYMCEEKQQNYYAVGSQELLMVFRRINKFHPALESNEKELNYLRAFVEVLGHSMLPVDLYRCSSARYILHDILTKNVMLPLVDKLSDPHWLHETLIKILSNDIDSATNAQLPQVRLSHTCNISRLNKTEDTPKNELELTLVDVPQQPDTHGIVHTSRSREDFHAQLTTKAGADTESQADLCETIHVLDTSSLRESDTDAETEKDNTIITSLPCGGNLDRSAVSQKGELEEQQMYVAHDLGRYLHVLSDSHELQQDQGNSKQVANEKLSQHHRRAEFDEVERHRTFLGHCVFSRSRSHSFSSVGCVSSGSDASVSGRKAKFLLEQDDFSSQSDIGSRQSLDLDMGRTLCRPAPLGCSFRRKWISSENILQVKDNDSSTGSTTLAAHRRSRSVTNLPSSTADDECPASEGNTKQDGQDWTAVVREAALAPISGEEEGHLFTSVTISDTVTAREPGSTGQYTLYVIQYTALCKSEDDHWGQHQFIVRRRHKEFVALQQRLGVYPVYKSELKGVKGPLRWMSLPFANMDRSSIESRRRFLQSYLQSLITKPRISGSDVMKEFFAYERDASIAFVKRAPEIPRIDKAITRTVSGMFNKISKIVPGTREVEPPSGRHAPQWLHDKRDVMNKPIEQEDWTDSLDVAFDVATATLDGEETLGTILAHCIHDNGTLVSDRLSCAPNGTNMIGRPRRSEGDGCDASKLHDKDDTPLTTIVTDLLTQLLTGRESWVKHSMAIHFFHIVFGPPLNKFLETELTSLTTAVKCGHYLQLLRESVWPDGQLTGPETVVSESQKEMTRRQARQCVYDYLPVLVPLVMGEDSYNYAVDTFMDSLDSATLNRHLLYCLLDQMLELIVPEVSSVEVQQELRQGDCHKDTADY